jgi:NTP pyrophosphatase (non-canonical NTP hydrolase)
VQQSCTDASAGKLAISGLWALIAEMFSQKDAARGIDETFMRLMEDAGELAGALRRGSQDELADEFADVLAWPVTIANVAGIHLEQAILEKYGHRCPGCGQKVCRCDLAEKP